MLGNCVGRMALLHQLPQETVDLVVDFAVAASSEEQHRHANAKLSSPTIRTLTTLSSTSRIFRRQCLVHLLKRLDVSVDREYDENALWKVERTLELFKAEPGLLTFVRELKVEMDFGNMSSDHPILEGPIDPAEWKSSSPRISRRKAIQGVLAKVFAMLGRLDALEIVHVPMPFQFLWAGGDDRRCSVEWGDVRRELRKALTRMIVVRSTESLKRVRISGLRLVPLRMLARLRGLKEIEIPNSTTTLGLNQEEHLPWNLGRLNAASGLDVLGSDLALLSGVYNQLTNLRVVIGTMADNSAVWSIVHGARETLVSLKLEYSPSRSEPNLVYYCFVESRHSNRTLPHCPQLQDFSISILAQQESARIGYTPSIPHTIPGLLSSLLEDSHLPALRAFSAVADVRISLDQLQTLPSVRFIDRLLGWDRLDEALADEAALPRLRSASVVVNPELVVEDGVSGVVPAWDCDEDVEDAVHESMRRELEDTLWKCQKRLRNGSVY